MRPVLELNPKKLRLFFALLLISTATVRGEFGLINVAHVNYWTNLYSAAVSVVVSNQLAYVAGSEDGLRILDVSDPTNPISIGHWKEDPQTSRFPNSADDLIVSGNYAYLANEHNGMRILDISNPADPVAVADVASNSLISGIALCSNRLYDAAGDVYDVSNPLNPIPLGGGFPGAVWPARLAVAGDLAYLASGINALQIYDVSNPSNIIKVSQFPTNIDASAEDIVISGTLGYLANERDGLRILDLSNPAIPISLGNITHAPPANYYAYRVTLSGSYAYVGDDIDGLRIYDVSDPLHPSDAGHINNPGNARGVAVSGNYAYLANGYDGLRIYFISPQLKISISPTNTMLISWPAPSTGFVLEQNSFLGATGWVTVTNTPVTLAGQNQVALTPSGNIRFYRLHLP